MIVRDKASLYGTDAEARGEGWETTRLLTGRDRMGFSLHETVISEGTELRLRYRHHREANYCLAGEGEVLDIASGTTWTLLPGTLYALERHDEHIVRALRGDLIMICVFNPPIYGDEVPETGGYGPSLIGRETL